MKAHVVLMIGAACLVGASSLKAQLSVPSTPTQFQKRNLGENRGSGGSSSVGVVPRNPAASQPIVVQLIAVSRMRGWTNAEGKNMTARLLAFSGPKAGETGPIEVIRDGKVRFLLAGGKEPVDYPLAQLSQKDQVDIKAIAQAAKRSPAPQPETPEPED